MSAAPASFAENLRGAGFMAVSMAGFAANDALMKVLAVEAGFFEAVLLRGLGATLLMTLIAWRFGALRRLPPRRDAPALALRCTAEVCATICYLTALTRLPLATVSSVAQTMPLMITFAGALIFGERVGWRRWAAVAAGFAGVLVILRPGAEFQPAVLWALGGVTCFTIRDMATRRLSQHTASLFVTLLTAAAVTAMGAVALGWRAAMAPEAASVPWAEVGPWEAAGLAAAVLCILTGYGCGVNAMRSGDIGFVAPFRYTVLVWAIAIGFLAFGEQPDAQTWAGAAIIVSAGLYAFFRERRAAVAASSGARPR